MNLFNDSGAEFSDCRKYRFALWRIWEKSKPLVMFIGLNPSTANAQKNDNTITKVNKIASNNLYGGVYMMNLFPYITSKPSELDNSSQLPIVYNDLIVKEISKKCKDIVFAWGAFKQAKEKAKIYATIFPDALCLRITKDGSPWHPLYCRDNTRLIPYRT